LSCSRSGGGNNAETAKTAGAWCGFDDNFNVTAEECQEVHEALSGETRKTPAQETRDFRLIDFQDPGRPSLSKPAPTDRRGDANRKISLSQTLLRIWQANVCKYISAAFHYIDSSTHFVLFPSAAPAIPCVLLRPV
jgi:hypothetical protein